MIGTETEVLRGMTGDMATERETALCAPIPAARAAHTFRSVVGGGSAVAYAAANVGFLLFILCAVMFGPGQNPRIFYLVSLFSICSSPILVTRAVNDRYTCYLMFLALYFVSFGMLDAISLVTNTAVSAGVPSTPLTASESLILLGAACFAAGYLIQANRDRGLENLQALAADWPMPTLLTVGTLFWLLGTVALWYWDVRLTVRAGQFNNDVGGIGTTALMLGRYAQPLGIMIIAYAYSRSRSKVLAALTVVVVLVQIMVGFVSNSKETTIVGVILVVLMSVLVRGKIPKVWAAVGVLFVALAFPVMQASRAVVVGERGMSNAEVAQHIGAALMLSVQGAKEAANDSHSTAAERPQSFFERDSSKGSIEMIVTRTGKDVPFQHGHTLIPLLFVFIPRLLWPTKVDVQTGELVNTEFHVTGESSTYISPSHLGDLYWNFGWPGALIGMLLLGTVLGRLNRICDLSTGVSITRVLILAVSIYELGARFEGAVNSEYAMWIRSLVGILILHRLFARPTGSDTPISTTGPGGAHPGVASALPFPNLMR